MHRIPGGRGGGGAWRGPVFLQHGIFGATDSWVFRQCYRQLTETPIGGSITYFMADDGYDVWIGNTRGNYYSREHVNFTAKDKRFWRFSWHEMGMYDTPAMVDYVLKETGREKLIHVAHSMGNNIYYVMLSNKPEYVNKFRLKIDIAPSVFWDNMKAPIGKIIRDNHRLIKVIMDLQNTYELLRPSPARKAFYFFGCHKNSSQRKLCGSLFYASVGVSGVRDKNKLPIHLARMMESTSGPTMVHLAQNAKSGRFCQFDYGTQGNIKHYGTPHPPEYDLKKATVPTVLYTSTGDDLVPADGVVRLSQEIPNALELYWVPEKIFNHLDFLVHEETHDLLLHHMLKVMSKY
ncbi:Lipase 3 [Gryllus bimaculatus]|nr:Lipase 3 [Gryllus bimaculatus]